MSWNQRGVCTSHATKKRLLLARGTQGEFRRPEWQCDLKNSTKIRKTKAPRVSPLSKLSGGISSGWVGPHTGRSAKPRNLKSEYNVSKFQKICTRSTERTAQGTIVTDYKRNICVSIILFPVKSCYIFLTFYNQCHERLQMIRKWAWTYLNTVCTNSISGDEIEHHACKFIRLVLLEQDNWLEYEQI